MRRNTHIETRAFALALFVVLALILIADISLISRTTQTSAVASSELKMLTNEYRKESGASLLVENSQLTMAAEAKARDMAERSYFSHQTPEGEDPWVFLDRVGYPYTIAGENLAVNFNKSTTVTTAWMNSPAHRANILNGEFTEIGIGIAPGIYKGRQATFVVQFFARPVFSR